MTNIDAVLSGKPTPPPVPTAESAERAGMGVTMNREQLLAYAVDLMRNRGYNIQETARALGRHGVDEQSATAIATQISTHLSNAGARTAQSDKSDAYSAIGFGLLWLVGGVVLSMSIGGLFYGAIIYGLIKVVIGIVGLAK